MGQGGKVSLANTVDVDILEYILAKLEARIVAKSRTFLIKVKAHRREPLNEGEDDLAEAGREMEKEGENSRWRGGVSILRPESGTVEKRKNLCSSFLEFVQNNV